MITVVNTGLEHVDALEALQRIVFARLTEIAQYSAAMYRRHIEIFPDGQFTALLIEEGREVVVGATTTFRTPDFDHIRLPFEEGISWLKLHDPAGEWLYGADISVHPDYRRRGIASQLYAARAALVRRLNLRGEMAAGLLPGYHQHGAKLTIEQYVERVVSGELTDPTVSAQLRNGFAAREIIYDYIDDPLSGNCALLIVRENPDYRPDD